jgi:cytoskeletal protein CcmA (bactofilin family)
VSFSKTEVDSAFALAFDWSVKSPARDSLNQTSEHFEDWLKDLPDFFPGPKPAASSTRRGQPREIIFEGKLIVKGYLAGELSSADGELMIDVSGEIDGDIHVPSVIIAGSVRGDIYATCKVELRRAARVIGDIETAELRIQSGAVFTGQCMFPKSSRPPSAEEFVTIRENERPEFAIV